MPFFAPNSRQWMHEQYAPCPVHLQKRRKLQGVSIGRHSYGRIFTPSCLANREPETTSAPAISPPVRALTFSRAAHEPATRTMLLQCYTGLDAFRRGHGSRALFTTLG